MDKERLTMDDTDGMADTLASCKTAPRRILLVKGNPTTATLDEELDPQVLRRLEADTNPVLLRRVINLFIDETTTRLRDIAAARAVGDWQRLQREAHILKSSAGTLGAKRLQEYARRLDHTCRNGDLVTAHHLAESIDKVAALALEALTRYYFHLPTSGPQTTLRKYN